MAESNPIAPKPIPEHGEVHTPEDVATLYSWANLHGAKYRDFSASRAQAREEARLRVEEALAEQRRKEAEEAERRAQEEAQIAARAAAEAAEAARQAEADRLAEIARQAEAERQAVLAAQEAQRQAAQQRAWQPAATEIHSGAQTFKNPEHAQDFDPFSDGVPGLNAQPYYPQPVPEAPTAGAAESPAQYASVRTVANPFQNSQTRSTPQPPARPFTGAMPPTPAPQELPSPWNGVELRENSSAPAWLSVERRSNPAARQAVGPGNPYPSEPAPSAAMRQTQFFGPGPATTSGAASGQFPPATPHRTPVPTGRGESAAQQGFQAVTPAQSKDPGEVDETLFGSRDRVASRWFALKGVFDPQAAPEQIPAMPPARVPVLAVFSLAGGVGKTSLVASLGRALSSRGERVLLVDTAAYGLLPFFFGARDQRPGQLRTFNPPGSSADAPIQLVTFDPESRPPEYALNQPQSKTESQPISPDWLTQEIVRCAHGVHRVLVDLPTASGATTRRILRMAPIVVVPVLPDMNSVVSVGAIEGFFRNNASHSGGIPSMPFYVLNQFDSSLPLHLDVREILREQIGDRLIPIALRRSPTVSEALAEGMTVTDYAPGASVAEDYVNLAGWVRSVSAPAAQSYRGVRWSER